MSDQTTTGAEQAKSKTASKTASSGGVSGPVMYIGPNRPYDLPLMHNQIFKDAALPVFCQSALKAFPHFGTCFVAVKNLGKALSDLSKSGTEIAVAAAKVVSQTRAMRASGKTLVDFIAAQAEKTGGNL